VSLVHLFEKEKVIERDEENVVVRLGQEEERVEMVIFVERVKDCKLPFCFLLF